MAIRRRRAAGRDMPPPGRGAVMPPPGRGAIIGPPPIIGRPPKPPKPNAAAAFDPAIQQSGQEQTASNSARIDRELIALFRMANSRCSAEPITRSRR